MLPVSLDQKSKLVLVGDYGKRFRTQDDHQQLSLIPIVETDHPANLLELRRHITSNYNICLLYTSPSPRDRTRSRMPSSA